MLHEPTSPPVGTERKAEKDVKTKQGIQLPSAFVRLNVLVCTHRTRRSHLNVGNALYQCTGTRQLLL